MAAVVAAIVVDGAARARWISSVKSALTGTVFNSFHSLSHSWAMPSLCAVPDQLVFFTLHGFSDQSVSFIAFSFSFIFSKAS